MIASFKNKNGSSSIRKEVVLLDSIVILLQLCYRLSLLHAWIFDLIPIQPEVSIAFFMMFVYLLRFGTKLSFFKNKVNNPLIAIWIIVYFWEVFQGIFFFTELSAIKSLFLVIDYLFFVEYLYSVVKSFQVEGKSFEYIIKSYCVYNIYSLFIVLIASAFFFFGFIHVGDNPLPPNSLTIPNIEEAGENLYSFPGYLSVVSPDARVLNAFNIPMLSGLSHEPHVYHYTILPAFFLVSFYLYKKKNIRLFYTYIFATLLSLIISTSITSILVFPVCIFIHLFWQSQYDKNKIKYLLTLMLFIIVLVFVLYEFGDIFSSIVDLINAKSSSSDGSKDYSMQALLYFISPHSIIGHGIHGNLGLDVLKDSIGVGIISSCLIVFGYLFTVYKAIRCVFSSSIIKHFIGLSSLYFLIHTLKVGALTFKYPLFIYIIFLLSMADYFAKQEIENDIHNRI